MINKSVSINPIMINCEGLPFSKSRRLFLSLCTPIKPANTLCNTCHRLSLSDIFAFLFIQFKYFITTALLIILASSAATEENIVPPFTAIYDINPPRAELTIQVSYNATHTFYTGRILNKGLLASILGQEANTKSIAQQTEYGQYFPIEYFYEINQQPSSKKKYIFDWQSNQISMLYKGKNYLIPFDNNVLDENIIFLQIALDAKKFGLDLNKNYQIANKGKVKSRHFSATKIEQIQTKLGEIKTLQVERKKRGKLDRILWLSYQHYFLPVKINIVKNGKIKQTFSIVRFNQSD